MKVNFNLIFCIFLKESYIYQEEQRSETTSEIQILKSWIILKSISRAVIVTVYKDLLEQMNKLI